MWLKLMLVLIALAAIIALLSLARRGPRLSADLQDSLDIAREHYELPALAACVVTPEKIETAVSGVREIGQADPVTPDDYWHIGSNAKAVTATLAGVLQEEGLLSLEDKLGAGFSFPLYADYKEVTLRDLLEHRSGLAPFTAGGEFDPYRDQVGAGSPSEQRMAFAELMLSQPAAVSHGRYEYSNAGYGIAAAYIEARTGRGWEELLREKLFDPLGMRVRFGWPATEEDQHHPLGHFDEGRGLEPLAIGDHYELPAALDPAGDLSMPISDYARFLQLHLRGMLGLTTEVSGAEGLRSLVKPETIKRLHEPNGDYSCGWIETRILGLVESSHDGSAGTFYMTAMVDASNRVAVAAVANAGTPAAERAVHTVARRMQDVFGRRHAKGELK